MSASFIECLEVSDGEPWRIAGYVSMMTQAAIVPLLSQMVECGISVEDVMKIYRSFDVLPLPPVGSSSRSPSGSSERK